MDGFSVKAEQKLDEIAKLPAGAPSSLRRQIRQDAQEQVYRDVFGSDHKKDRHGRPIEQGLGSHVNPSRQSIEAYKKFGKDEPDFGKNLARMEERLAEVQAQRAKSRPAVEDED
jgi:hypothetical protein